MLMSSGGQLKCRKCGYIRIIDDNKKIHNTLERKEKEIMIVDEEEEKMQDNAHHPDQVPQMREQSCNLVAPSAQGC